LSFKQRVFRALVQPLERLIFQPQRTKAVIAVSERVRTDLGRCYGRTSDVTVIYHGVDTAAFNPENRTAWRKAVRAEWNVTDERFVALYVGDLQKAGPPALASIVGAPDVTLVLVSATPSAAFRALAERLGVEKRVLFLPHTKTIERAYAASDAFLFPSAYDTFGLVVAEAMATGLPVLTSAEAGAAEWIESGRNGVVIEPAWDSDAYAGWLNKLAADPTLRSTMGAAARQTVETYTWDRTAAETLAVYQRVCERKRARRPHSAAGAP
jgi:glycosyltransferase involved in cell wall biosynthesis